MILSQKGGRLGGGKQEEGRVREVASLQACYERG